MSVAECQERVDAVEFRNWQLYAEIEPFGQDWLQTGMICMLVAAANSGKKGRKWKPEDFMPITKRATIRRQTSEEMQQILMVWAGGGTK